MIIPAWDLDSLLVVTNIEKETLIASLLQRVQRREYLKPSNGLKPRLHH